jgi:hypothetical protein
MTSNTKLINEIMSKTNNLQPKYIYGDASALKMENNANFN